MPPNPPEKKNKIFQALIVIVVVAFIAIVFSMNHVLMKKAGRKTENRFNRNQFTQTKIAANAIEDYLDCLYESTAVFAKCSIPSAVSKKTTFKTIHNLFTSETKERPCVTGMFFFSNRETPLVYSLKEYSPKGKLLSFVKDFSYSKWDELKESRNILNPSSCGLFTRNHQMLAFGVPIYSKNEFNGALIVLVDLKPLIKRFVEPLRSGKYGAGYMLAADGTIVYDHEKGIIGRNVFDGMHDKYPTLLAVDKRLVSEDSGSTEYTFTVKRNSKVSRKLISWNTVKIADERLAVCLSAPDIEIDSIISETRSIQNISLTLLMAVGGAFLYILIRKEREYHIRKNEKHLVLALEGNRDGVWDWNVKTGKVYFSTRWKEMLGYEDNEIKGDVTEWESRIHPEDKERTLEDIGNHLKGMTEFYENEHRLRCKDGSYIWILDRGKVYETDRDGNPLAMIGTHTDITEKKTSELEIRKLSLAVENSPSAVVITDSNATIRYVNKRFEEITKYSADELIGKNPSTLKSDMHSDDIYRELWETISSGKNWSGEIINRAKDGSHYWCRLSISPVVNENGVITAYVGIQEDLTELKKKEAELKRLATTDELTKINNRRRLLELAAQEHKRSIRYSTPMTLVMLDLDHFKDVNDTYGHDCGDLVLVETARLLKKSIREIDSIGRIGGEEFALILAQTEAFGAQSLLERLRDRIEHHVFTHNNIQIRITASLGFSSIHADNPQSLDQLMIEADKALYNAKDRGRNRVVNYSEIHK